MKSPDEPFSLKKRINSFSYAFKGLSALFRFEHNSRIHLFFAVLAVAAGFLLNISPAEWTVLIIIITMVFTAEIFNSAIEHLSDLVSREHNITIGRIKDLCSAAVLITAIASVIIGFIIFLPKIMLLF